MRSLIVLAALVATACANYFGQPMMFPSMKGGLLQPIYQHRPILSPIYRQPIFRAPILKGSPIISSPILKGGPIYTAPIKGVPMYSKGIQQSLSVPFASQSVTHQVVVDNSLMHGIGGDDMEFGNDDNGHGIVSGISTSVAHSGISTGVSHTGISAGLSGVNVGSIGHFDQGFHGSHGLTGLSQTIASPVQKVPTIGGVY